MDNRTRNKLRDKDRKILSAEQAVNDANKRFAKLKDNFRRVAAELGLLDDAVMNDPDMQHTFELVIVALRQRIELCREVIDERTKAETLLQAKTEELDRVWYMLRAITGDSTLRRDLLEQADHGSHNPAKYAPPTPFNKPQY